MLNATRDTILPTTITGSYPRPHWFTEELRGRVRAAGILPHVQGSDHCPITLELD